MASHIGVVGGLDRNEGQYAQIAALAGYTLEHHSGCMAGRGAETLAALVERCSIVIVITDVNSHAAMWRARRLSRAAGRTCVLIRRLGPSRFRMMLNDLKLRKVA